MHSRPITLDMDAAIDRLGDRDLFLEVAHSFAGRLPEMQSALEDALHHEDWPSAARSAHSLKSNCATVGAEALRAVAARLERALHEKNREEAEALLQELLPTLPALREALLCLS